MARSRVPPPARRPRYLLPAERPWVNVRRHWSVLLHPGLRGVGLLALLYLLLFLTSGAGALSGLVLVAMAGILCWLAWRVAEWRHDRFVVTDKRVLLVTGLLTRRVGMMPLLKVTDMTYERSWTGRWLGYGAFVMESAGQDQALHRVDHVPYPDQVAQTMFALLFGPPVSRPRPAENGAEPAGEEAGSLPPPDNPPGNVVVVDSSWVASGGGADAASDD